MTACLVIDDVEVSRYAARIFLEELGVSAIEAEDAAGALRALSGGSVNVILLDWHLKKDNGLDLIKKIKATASGRGVPIIVFSGVEGREKEGEARAAGADSFIVKPTTRDKIETELKKFKLI